MTAEIAILNRGAVALAADSAVTITVGRGQKIYNTVNKLFTLSKYRPVGIMVYGAADFMGIPWESIIKEHRREIGLQECGTLREYVDRFLSWIKSTNSLFPATLQDQFLSAEVRGYFDQLKDLIEKRVGQTIKEKGPVTDEQVAQIVSGLIGEECTSWRAFPRLTSVAENFESGFLARHGPEIDSIRQQVFENLPITPEDAASLQALVADVFCRDNFGSASSGLVIAGFGAKEIFPSLIHCALEGMIDDSLKWKEVEEARIDHSTFATIVPFAQREMVDTFLSGVDPTYSNTLLKALRQLLKTSSDELIQSIPDAALPNKVAIAQTLGKKIPILVKSFAEKMQNYSQDKHISPVLSAVAALPKDELAAMAESLVNLTSFKRKVSTDAETVGGQIDVAVISKGDGFIWIKRKHYFEIGKNPQFVANYNLERQHE
jgi:hypothetical protein